MARRRRCTGPETPGQDFQSVQAHAGGAALDANARSVDQEIY